MEPRTRKAVLSGHLVVTVGWAGASLCLAALNLTGLFAGDEVVRTAVYVAAGGLVRFVTLPLSLLSLASGIVIGLGTKWGLLRHWWVLISLIGTAAMAALVVFALMPLTGGIAADVLAAESVPVREVVGGRAVPAVVAPCVATVALSALTALNVYKPRGRVRRGAHRRSSAAA
ncbi:hypothetical protein [Actinopolyspora halophila]|uniref:hypothetical protein n=1 Tax=Actinopolyspora halophila TaxID=1850 RepID=UPI0003A04036|nr:hypothetical protein [Actinopolyspora halophila]